MAAVVTLDEHNARLAQLREEKRNLDAEWEGKRFDDITRSKFNELEGEIRDLEETVDELEKRKALVERDMNKDGAIERAEFHVPRPRSVDGADIYDLSTIERSWDHPEEEERQLRDRALKAIERAHFPHPDVDEDEGHTHLERMLGDGEGGDRRGRDVAMHMLATGSPAYRRAFTKYASGQPRTTEEEGMLYRAMSLTAASGGVAVPFVLDPTLLPSYNGAVNPFRAISDVRTITVDEWRGVTSGGITAAFQAEAAATTDQSPTLASVSISTEMARVFIPYSIEIGMDWSSFASDMAQEIQNSKDVLEAAKFAVGSGTNEPFGVVTGATTLFTSSDSAALFSADIYGWFGALPPLYRSRAVAVMNNSTLNRIRQLDTAGGSAMLTPNLQVASAANVGSMGGPSMTDARANVDIFGKAVYEASEVASFADNALIGVVGAFNPYFKIIDRIGLTIENIPHIFGAAQGNLPTGQRGLFAYWRTGSKVVHANAFRTLRVA
jgi:HK97 family phage major capsid protein